MKKILEVVEIYDEIRNEDVDFIKANWGSTIIGSRGRI